MITMTSINTFKMRILTKPFEGVVFCRDSFKEEVKTQPFVVGEGSLTYACGGCGLTIMRTIRRGQVTQAIYKCPKCGAYNQIESAEGKH